MTFCGNKLIQISVLLKRFRTVFDVLFFPGSPGFGFCSFYLTYITFIDVNGIAESLESTVITDHITDQTTEIIPDLKVFVLLCYPIFYFILFSFSFSFLH